jgi:phosphoglycolate phosphatase-like HAD superfamily hydrolase
LNIICDLDGTIALDHGRAHHLHHPSCAKYPNPNNHNVGCLCTAEERDWKSYFDACETDEPCHAVIEVINALSQQGHDIWILSGRSMSASIKTLAWLKKYHVEYEYIQMRSVEDRTADDVLKLDWAEAFNLTPKNTLFVLEDRTRVVEAWRAAGFRCFQVAPGNF